MKLWAGRFQKQTDELVNDFNASISFDQRLYKQDITGSMAHAQMLCDCGILTAQELEQLMESRKFYRYQPGQAKLHPTDSSERYYLGVSAPILSEGDLMGCVMLLLEEQDEPLGDAEQKLVQTVAGFLGRQMES